MPFNVKAARDSAHSQLEMSLVPSKAALQRMARRLLAACDRIEELGQALPGADAALEVSARALKSARAALVEAKERDARLTKALEWYANAPDLPPDLGLPARRALAGYTRAGET